MGRSPAIPGCATQGDSMEELIRKIFKKQLKDVCPKHRQADGHGERTPLQQ